MTEKPENISGIDVERAWKDKKYRETLTAAQLAQLPPDPNTLDELTDDDLEDISGGTYTASCYTPG